MHIIQEKLNNSVNNLYFFKVECYIEYNCEADET